MRESFTYGSVGRAPGNRCLYLEADQSSLKGSFATAQQEKLGGFRKTLRFSK